MGPDAVFTGEPDHIMVINKGFLVATTPFVAGVASAHVNADHFTDLPKHAAALNIGSRRHAAAAAVGDANFKTFDYDMSMRRAAPIIGAGVAAATISVRNFQTFANDMLVRLATPFVGSCAMAAFFNKLNIWNLKFKFKPSTVATLKKDVLPFLPVSCV